MMPAKTNALRDDISELMKSGAFNQVVDRCHIELTMARRENQHSVEIIALLGLSQAQCSLGHFDFARDYASQAIELAEQSQSIGLMVDALMARARVSREGYFQTHEAFDDYNQAVSYAFEASDMRRYGQALLGLGEISSQPADSSKHAWKVIDIARELKDLQLEARAVLLLSNVFIRRREYSKASDGLLVALQKAQAAKDRLLESIVIGQQGAVLAQSPQSFQKGLEQQLTALEAARGMEAIFHEFMRLHTLAMTMIAVHDLAAARGFLDQMLALSQDVHHTPYQMYTLGMMGQWQEMSQKPDIALSYYRQAADAARQVKNPAYEARYLYALGAAHQSRWDFEAARQCYGEARALYRALDDGRNATRVTAAIVYTYLLALAGRLLKLMGFQPGGSA